MSHGFSNEYRIVYYTHVFIGFRGKFHGSILILTQAEVNGVKLLNWNIGFWYLDCAKCREGEAKTVLIRAKTLSNYKICGVKSNSEAVADTVKNISSPRSRRNNHNTDVNFTIARVLCDRWRLLTRVARIYTTMQQRSQHLRQDYPTLRREREREIYRDKRCEIGKALEHVTTMTQLLVPRSKQSRTD